MDIIRLITCILLLSAGLSAQGIAPPIAEYRGNKVDGMFEVQNTTNSAMAVILATKSFTVDENGLVVYRPLDGDVKIKIGANSFVIAPHDSRMVFYKASVKTSPNSFSVIATITKAQAEEGMRLNYVFPHMIYVYQKEKLNRSDITIQLIDGTLFIHNLSQKLGRVEEVTASKQELGGFPIYPGQTRGINATGASKATVKFEDGFKIEIP